MSDTTFHGRRAASLENEHLRVTVLEAGGHIAEILDKETGVNPLWIPPWKSIEPSNYDARRNPEYGAGAEAKLLAGIMGHNLCLDFFGGPSPEEAAAGLTVHGEASVEPYDIERLGDKLVLRAHLQIAEIAFERKLELLGRAVKIHETVRNLTGIDRPIGWTQHVTLGPPFLERGVTQFRLSATRSKVYEREFGSADYLKRGADFDWPMAPRADGGEEDLRVLHDAPASGAFTSHLMDPAREDAFFAAFHPGLRLIFGYVWRRADFPWTGIWEENRSRSNPPWGGKTLARGMEFGVSPVPESRREMVDRSQMFGVPAFRWLPANGTIEAEYRAVTASGSAIPESL